MRAVLVNGLIPAPPLRSGYHSAGVFASWDGAPDLTTHQTSRIPTIAEANKPHSNTMTLPGPYDLTVGGDVAVNIV